jgi:hypothetical protein
MKFLIMKCSPLPFYQNSPNALFSNTLSLSSSLNVSDQALHQYKTGKITRIFLYILIFKFLERQKILHRMIASIPWF